MLKQHFSSIDFFRNSIRLLKWLFFLIFTLSISGCMKEGLSVFTEYVSIESLPSYHIQTPDPRLFAPDVGEKLHISWKVKNFSPSQSLQLKLSLQFGDRTTDDVWIDLYAESGTYVYPLLNEEYWTKQGIFTYQVELFRENQCIYLWQHQMWAKRIELTSSANAGDVETSIGCIPKQLQKLDFWRSRKSNF